MILISARQSPEGKKTIKSLPKSFQNFIIIKYQKYGKCEGNNITG